MKSMGEVVAYARRCTQRALDDLAHVDTTLGSSQANVRRIRRAIDELANADGALSEFDILEAHEGYDPEEDDG